MSMKMVASRELSARPAAVWADVVEAGAVVVTRDGIPMGIITPTSPETLLEDLQEIAFARARHAVRDIRASAAGNGTAALSPEAINAEIRGYRKSRN